MDTTQGLRGPADHVQEGIQAPPGHGKQDCARGQPAARLP